MKRKSLPRRIWSTSWKAVLLAGILAVVALVATVSLSMASLPSFSTLMKSPNGQAVRVVSSDGVVLVNEGPSYGAWLHYDDIPPVMVGAMVAVEDKRFWRHPGISPRDLARAVYVSLREGEGAKATSTITQQLARNLFLTNDRTFVRKGKEAILALAMEQRFSKEQILELYLNRVYFGGGAYGIDAASRRFYGHSAKELSPAEAAIIAGLVKAPSRFAPSSDPERARGRAAIVAQLMAQEGVVPDGNALREQIGALSFAEQPRQNDVRYFTDWVLQQVDDLTDERVEPLVVTTTLDAGMQLAAQNAIDAQAPAGVQAALVSMTPGGAVRAMMGGKDYVESNYNRATIAERQPGSAFKLFVYLTAIENGVTPYDVVQDAPVQIEGWSPRNYTRGYHGPVTVRQAFAQSYNTVAAELGQRVGFSNVAMMASRLGIDTPVNTRPAMVLGTSNVRLISMTGAYAAVANGGVFVDPYGIEKIETANGRLLYEHKAARPRVVLAPWVVTNMTYLLEHAMAEGTGKAAQFGKPAGGKTGTTSNYQDGYFVGFSRNLVTGVWMGRDDNKAVRGLTGGSSPARAFSAYMRVATKGMKAEPLNSDIGAEEELFAEPDMEVYGLDGEWDPAWGDDPYAGFDDLTRGETGGDPSLGNPGYAGGAGVEVRRRSDGSIIVYGDDGAERPPVRDPANDQDLLRRERERVTDLRAGDVPTRPRTPAVPGQRSSGTGDAWLDQPVRRTQPASRVPAGDSTTQPAPKKPSDGPQVLLPSDPM